MLFEVPLPFVTTGVQQVAAAECVILKNGVHHYLQIVLQWQFI